MPKNRIGFGTNLTLVDNKIGIGTTNPLNDFNVFGNVLISAGTATTQHITIRPYTINNGTLSFEGSAGQLFSVTNNLTSGSIFSVNDVSGIPSIDVNADGTVDLAPFNGRVGVAVTNPIQVFQVGAAGTNVVVVDSIGEIGIGTTNPIQKLDVVGNIRVSGLVTTRDIFATGISTFVGIVTTRSDLYVGGDLYVLDDLVFDSFSANNFAVTGVATASIFVGNLTGNINSTGVSTATTLLGTNLSYSGVGTITTLNSTTGTVTNISGTNLNYTGISTITNVRSTTLNNSGVGTITTLNSTTGTVTTLGGTNLSYSGVSTFTNGPVLIGAATSTGTSLQRLQVTGNAYVSGNVGIGTTLPQYKLQVVGDFGATTKSFVIPHPTKPGMTLRHGVLEGPENSVYIRGKTKEAIITLPDYWTGLVDEESISVNLTSKNGKLHSVIGVSNNTVEIECIDGDIDCYFIVLGERKDVAKLVVEY